MPVNNPWYVQKAFDWLQGQPIIGALIVLMIADVICGVFLALIKGRLNSTASWRGMCKKAIMLILIGAVAGIGNLIPSVPMLQLLGTFFTITELISLLENAAAAGVPLPRGLISALSKMRDQKMEQAIQKGASTVNNITVLSPPSSAPVTISPPEKPQ